MRKERNYRKRHPRGRAFLCPKRRSRVGALAHAAMLLRADDARLERRGSAVPVCRANRLFRIPFVQKPGGLSNGMTPFVCTLAMTLVLFFSAPAMAACSNPAGYGGDMNYNTSQSEMQYCDGTDWISMGAGPGTGGGCANPAGSAGDMNYNTTYHVAMYCNGQEWVAMGPSGDDAMGISRAGLLGHWKLDDGTGSGTAADSTGNGHTGTLSGIPTATAWVNGVVNGALTFGGNFADDYVDVLDDPALRVQTLTISAWVKSSVSGLAQIIATKRYDWTIDPYNSYIIEIEATNKYGFCLSTGVAGQQQCVQSAAAYNTTNWHLVSATFDGTTMKLYVDGALSNSSNAFSGQSIGYSALPLRIGRANTPSTWSMNGLIDDLRVYGRALSATEIQNLYDASSYNAGLVGHWTLDDGAGTTATDSSGNGNNGTLTNGPTWTNGIKSGAVQLDGTDDVVVVGDDDAFTPSALTVSAWVQPDDIGVSRAIVSKWNWLGGSTTEWLMVRRVDNKFYFEVCDGDCSTSYDSLNITSTTTSTAGQWYHVVGVWDGGLNAGNMKLYINGSSEGTGTEFGTFPGLTNTAQSVVIGAAYTSSVLDRDFSGRIDDVRIYDRALSATEIQSLYGCTSPTDTEGTMQYNPSYRTMQYCNGYNWVGVGKVVPSTADCPNIGDVCNDGSVYAGLSPDGNVRMFTTPADAGTFAWNNGNATGKVTTGMTSTTTGEANSNALFTIDSDSGTAGSQPHLAAQHCMNLTAHGHTDWYLPAESEAGVLYTNRAAIGGFNTSGGYPAGYYWTSTEVNNGVARTKWFSTGTNGGSGKEQSGHAVRCVRK